MLLILESPSKCATVAKFLDCKCVATCGHLQTLDSVSDDFTPKYKTNTKQVAYLKDIISQFDAKDIYLACDYDREGEAICAQICELFGLDIATTKRIVFREITKTALQHAVANPTTIDQLLVSAQQTRQIIDMAIGYKISPILWNNVASNTPLSAGRCQTPALRIIYDNQFEIDSEEKGGPQISVTGMFHKTKYLLDRTFTDSADALTFLTKTAFFVHVYDREEPQQTDQSAPRPFTTSRLQQVASNLLKFSPSDTMVIAQKLYEHGLITYMRTDSDQYSAEFTKQIVPFIMGRYGAQYPASMTHQNQKAHEAIRITSPSLEELDAEWPSRERRLYKLIWTNSVESCMRPAVYSKTRQTITAHDGAQFVNVHELLVFHGFKIVKGEKPTKPFKCIAKGQVVKYESVYTDTSQSIKSHISEARLVNILEERGIGRPSTFASLVDKLKDRKYVAIDDVSPKIFDCDEYRLSDGGQIQRIIHYVNYGQEKNVVLMQPIGKRVSDFLQTNYAPLFAYEFTRELEDDLDKVSLGVLSPVDVYNKIRPLLATHVTEENGLKKGKYGVYMVVDGKNVPVEGFGNRPIENVKPDEIVIKVSTILRKVSEKLSIRKGPNGNYIYYQTGKRPVFHSLEGYPGDYLTCDLDLLKHWIKMKYGKF